MHPNYPIWPFHNFTRRRPIDRVINQIYRARYKKLLTDLHDSQKKWEQLYLPLEKSLQAESLLHEALKAHNAAFRFAVRIAQTYCRALPEAHTLDVKLSLLAEFLTTDEEKKITQALGIAADHPALQDRSFNSAVRGVLVQTQFRKLFTALVNKLKTWAKNSDPSEG